MAGAEGGSAGRTEGLCVSVRATWKRQVRRPRGRSCLRGSAPTEVLGQGGARREGRGRGSLRRAERALCTGRCKTTGKTCRRSPRGRKAHEQKAGDTGGTTRRGLLWGPPPGSSCREGGGGKRGRKTTQQQRKRNRGFGGRARHSWAADPPPQGQSPEVQGFCFSADSPPCLGRVALLWVRLSLPGFARGKPGESGAPT